MTNEELKKESGIVTLISLEAYQNFLTVFPENEYDKLKESMMRFIKLAVDKIDGLYDYCLETIPLAQKYGVYEWYMMSIEIYKKPILEKLQEKKENE